MTSKVRIYTKFGRNFIYGSIRHYNIYIYICIHPKRIMRWCGVCLWTRSEIGEGVSRLVFVSAQTAPEDEFVRGNQRNGRVSQARR